MSKLAVQQKDDMMVLSDLLFRSRKRAQRSSAPRCSIGNHIPVFAEPRLSPTDAKCVQDFSRLYYDLLNEGAGLHTIVIAWMGHEMFKCPLDLWIYQELIVMHRFDVIIEIGTYKGGSALFLASILDMIGDGQVISVDIDDTHGNIRPVHDRIEYIHGSSLDPDVFSTIEHKIAGKTNPLVILDGDHTCAHVLKELHLYSSLIPKGGYLIVEDTNVNGHPAFASHGPGPWEAVDAFLKSGAEFTADLSCERFLLTMNPRGFLRRNSA